MEKIAVMIKQIRDLGLSQTEMSKELKLSQPYISGILKGKRGGRTPAETLERVKDARDRLRVDPRFDRRKEHRNS